MNENEIMLTTIDLVSGRDIAQLKRDGFDVYMSGNVIMAKRPSVLMEMD